MPNANRVVPRSKLASLGVCLVALSLLAHAGPVHAQVSANDKAAAEALFDYGLDLMRKGQYAEACVKLEQSQAIDYGIGTMLYLAECYERAGRTASAWALFRQAASEASAGGQAGRAEQGRQRAERLAPQLSKLTITVAQPSAAGIEVMRDGSPVASSLWGVPVPVDPGQHRIEARAPGYAPWTSNVEVSAHGDASAEVPMLAPVAVAPPAVVEAGALPPSAAGSEPSTTSDSQRASASASDHDQDKRGDVQRVAGLIVGSVGVVSLGIGTYFGVRAISKNSDAEKFCPGGGRECTDPRGESFTDEAQDAAALSNGFVIGGAVLTVTGALLYFLAPKSEERSLAIGSDGRSLHVVYGGVL